MSSHGTLSRVGFTSPELYVPIRCGLHSWETAYVSIFDHPYFAVTDGNGNFSIPDVPSGNYTLEVIHRKGTGTNGVLRAIAVRAGEKVMANFALELPLNGTRLAEKAGQLK